MCRPVSIRAHLTTSVTKALRTRCTLSRTTRGLKPVPNRIPIRSQSSSKIAPWTLVRLNDYGGLFLTHPAFGIDQTDGIRWLPLHAWQRFRLHPRYRINLFEQLLDSGLGRALHAEHGRGWQLRRQRSGRQGKRRLQHRRRAGHQCVWSTCRQHLHCERILCVPARAILWPSRRRSHVNCVHRFAIRCTLPSAAATARPTAMTVQLGPRGFQLPQATIVLLAHNSPTLDAVR